LKKVKKLDLVGIEDIFQEFPEYALQADGGTLDEKVTPTPGNIKSRDQKTIDKKSDDKMTVYNLWK